jgi:hypothetical protein
MPRLFSSYNYDRLQYAEDLLSATTLFRDILSRVMRPETVPTASAEEVGRVYSRSKAMIRAINQIDGARLMFVVQPVPGFRNAWLNNPYRKDICEKGAPCETALVDKMNALVAASRDADSYDLTRLFSDWTTTPVLDTVHYTPLANEAVAKALYEMIFPPAPLQQGSRNVEGIGQSDGRGAP